LFSNAIQCGVREPNCFFRIIAQSRSKSVNSGIITNDERIKTGAVAFDRRLSFLIWSLQKSVQHIAALAGGYFHFWGLIPTEVEGRLIFEPRSGGTDARGNNGQSNFSKRPLFLFFEGVRLIWPLQLAWLHMAEKSRFWDSRF
jgi:hypothetical protein